MEEEIDLGRYIEILFRRWYVIVGLTVGCVVIAALWLLLRPPLYHARALVAPVKTATQISFETRIRTEAESEQLVAADRNQRLASFAALVANPVIAQEVLAELGNTLPEELHRVPGLLRIVKGRLANKSDLIEILVEHPRQEVAIAIADAWAQHYVRYINQLYAGVAEEPYLAVKGELAQAEETYQEQEGALQAFLRQDRQAEINRRITELERVLKQIADTRSGAVPILLARIEAINRILLSAGDMRAQLQDGEDAAVQSNALALELLKVQAFLRPEDLPWMLGERLLVSEGSASSNDDQVFVSRERLPQSPQLPYNLTIQSVGGDIDVSATEMAQDLDALIATLTARRELLNRQLVATAEAMSRGEPWPFVNVGSDAAVVTGGASEQLEATARQLEQQLRNLRAELEQVQRQRLELVAQRDLAWETYDALRRKEAELLLAQKTQGVEVRLAALAAAHIQETSLLKNLALAAMIGLLLGILIIALLELWQGYRARVASAGAPQSGR